MQSAVVLAGGLGSRAWPYSGHRQKVTLPVLNVPLVRRNVLELAGLGLTEIAVVIGHRGAAVRSCLADLPYVRFVEQRQPTGTGEAALAGLEVVTGKDVVICYGDIVAHPGDMKRVIDAHSENGGHAVLLGTHRLPSATLAFSLETGAGGALSGLRGVNVGRTLMMYYAGVAAANRERMRAFLLRNPGIVANVGAGGMPPLESDLCCSLDMMARETGEVGVALCKKGVVDVDKPWQLVEASVLAMGWAEDAIENPVTLAEGATISDKAIIDSGVKLVLGKGASIGDYCRIQSSVVLADGAALRHGVVVRSDGPVFLGQKASANDYAFMGGHTVLGPETYLGHGAEFIGVTCEGASMRHGSMLCAVVGTKVNIAGGVMTANWRLDRKSVV